MITDIFLIVISSFVLALSSVLGLVSFAVPDGFESAVIYFMSYLDIFSGVFPVDVLFEAFGVFMSFWIAYQTYYLALMVYTLLPWIGQPTYIHTNTSNRRGMK